MRRGESYFISAGEASGDLLGADLALQIKERMPRVTAFGVTGTAMEDVGVESIATIKQFSAMGIFEVVKKVPELRMLEQKILREVELRKPTFAVLIDNAGFHLRLAEQLRMRGIRVVQYVAPKVWAWGQSRVEHIRRHFDLVLGILPFEESFFLEHGVNYEYVGNPLKDRTDKVMVNRANLGLSADRKIIACLPGSRYSEISRTLPIIESLKEIIRTRCDNIDFIVPIASNLNIKDMLESLGIEDEVQTIKEGLPGFALPTYEVNGLKFIQGMSLELMAAADVAVVTSGTATLECALLGTPMVVIYSMNDLTFQIAKKKMKVSWVSLVNLIANQELVHEYLQDFSLETVASDVLSLLNDEPRRLALTQKFDDIRDQLKGSAARNAAQAISERISKPETMDRGW